MLTHNRKKQLQSKYDARREDILCEDNMQNDYLVKRELVPEFQPAYDRCSSRERYQRDMMGVYSTRLGPLTPVRTRKDKKTLKTLRSEKALNTFQ